MKDKTLLDRSKIYFQGNGLWHVVNAIKNKKPYQKFVKIFTDRVIDLGKIKI